MCSILTRVLINEQRLRLQRRSARASWGRFRMLGGRRRQKRCENWQTWGTLVFFTRQWRNYIDQKISISSVQLQDWSIITEPGSIISAWRGYSKIFRTDSLEQLIYSPRTRPLSVRADMDRISEKQEIVQALNSMKNYEAFSPACVGENELVNQALT